MKVIIATGNPDKAREFRQMLPGSEVLTMREAGFTGDIEENGSSFAENAYIKAKAVWDRTGGLVFADDSGLCISAFNGEPGIYSARYLGEDTPYTEKNAVILDRLAGLPEKERSAYYACAICAILPDGSVKTVEEKMEGMIGPEPRGTNGFGYDPIFYLPELGKSVAELDADEKNRLSHRGKALRAMQKLLQDLPLSFSCDRR